MRGKVSVTFQESLGENGGTFVGLFRHKNSEKNLVALLKSESSEESHKQNCKTFFA